MMSKIKEKNCRLCLKMSEDECNLIVESTKEMFEVLLLKMDLSVGEDPVVCKNCMESAQEAFDFKMTCISVHKQIVSLSINRNSAELDIRDVYLNENENKAPVFNEDYNICRFCLQCLEKSRFKTLDDLRNNSIEEMLFNCIPEMALNIIKEPVVCAVCIKYLESYYSFIIKCRNTEENITKFCEAQGTECKGQISASNVPEVMCKSILEKALTADNVFQNETITNSDIKNVSTIEDEELIIKDENTYKDCEIEGNRCGETKQKEVVYDLLTLEESSDIVMNKCERCTYETKSKQNLKRHMLTHKDNSEVTTHKCNLCSYEVKWKYDLKAHMLSHKSSSDVVMYKCERCTFQTKYRRCLQRHIATHIDEEGTSYKCNLCSYKSKLKIYLKRHMLTHKDSSDVVMYRCEMCTYETKYKSGINRHVLIHKDNSEVTMYKCDLCSYKSKLKDYLKKHMLAHRDSSDVVMYRCEMCAYETKYKDNLKKHVLTHKDNNH